METHAILRRYAKDDTEAYTEEKGDHGRIVIPAQFACDNRPCPDPHSDKGSRHDGTDDTCNDDILSIAGDMLRKFGRHG